MKKTLFLLICLMLTNTIHADDDAYIISQKAKLTLLSSYQLWQSDNDDISEFSIPIQLYYPFSRSLSFSISGQQANASGDNYSDLRGLSDAQINCSYFLEDANLVLNSGINIPSGKKELTIEEFETSRILSLSHFNFRLPGFGQGLNLNFGATWAFPVSRNVVIGLGGSYQFKGSYKPLSDMEFDYNPGDEVLLTAGFDMAISRITSVSVDGIFTSYSSDKYNDIDIFKAGNKFTVAMHITHYIGYNDLSLFLRYRTRSKSSLPVTGSLTAEAEKSIPNNFDINAHYRFQLNNHIKLAILSTGRFYQASALNDGVSICGGGLGAEYLFNNNWSVLTNLKYYIGSYTNSDDFSGIEFLVGLSYTF